MKLNSTDCYVKLNVTINYIRNLNINKLYLISLLIF